MANFASRIGMILATAGAAVGLGNIWRFPTTAGENGGAAFMLFYILCTLLLGVPGMINEFIVGRSAGANAFSAYAKAGGGKVWGLVGAMGMVACTVILGFYCVVAGWCLYYFCLALTDGIVGDSESISTTFTALVSHKWMPSVLAMVFIVVTQTVIERGVQKGIERSAKLLMPILFVLLIVLIITSLTLPGAWRGVEFLFKPDFSKLSANVMFEAIGQSFFSLCLGAACLCTYAAYFPKKENLLRSAAEIAGIDTMVAIMAGLMIFPAAFAVGLRPDAGPSLIFQTLPLVFSQAFPHTVAYVVSVVFFFLLVLAALTSTISLHEIGTSLLSEELKVSRRKGATIVSIICAVIAVLSALSMGPLPMGFLGRSLFDNFDQLASNTLLPLGAFLTALLVGWRMPRQTVIDELTSGGRYRWPVWLVNIYLFLIRFVTPVSIIIIFLSAWDII